MLKNLRQRLRSSAFLAFGAASDSHLRVIDTVDNTVGKHPGVAMFDVGFMTGCSIDPLMCALCIYHECVRHGAQPGNRLD